MRKKKFCPHCKKKVWAINFCSICGQKLVKICDCWITHSKHHCKSNRCWGNDVVAQILCFAQEFEQRYKKWDCIILNPLYKYNT